MPALQPYWDPELAAWRYRPADFPDPPVGHRATFNRVLGLPNYPIPAGTIEGPATTYYRDNPGTGMLDPAFEGMAPGLDQWDLHDFAPADLAGVPFSDEELQAILAAMRGAP